MKTKNGGWMKGSFGISSHYTKPMSDFRTGGRVTYAEAVASLDADRIADTAKELGCTHYIFTLTHATQHLPCPCAALDAVLPGRTCLRDFVGDLIGALKRRNIRFVAYYNHSCNGSDDPEWKTACRYAAGGKENLDAFAANICSVVRELSLKYKDGIDGWWFDSAYSLDPRGKTNTVTTDLDGWLFPWGDLLASAESGNPDAMITVNAGINDRFRYCDGLDFWAGETGRLDLDAEYGDGLQQTRWLPLEGNAAWFLSERTPTFLPSAYGEDEVKRYLDAHLSHGNTVTFNLLTDVDGSVNPEAVAFLKKCRKA